MVESVTVNDLYQCHHRVLRLEWLASMESGDLAFRREPEEISSLVGYLNFVHPQQVTVLGSQEFTYLAKMDVKAYTESVNQLFSNKPTLIIIADQQNPTAEILQLAHNANIPLMTSSQQAQVVIDHLSHYLATKLAATITVHGVFMEVFDLGVLLTGESGVGKSELALELINRGHRLIADDSPIFSRFAPNVLTGACPPLLQDFLEVRGLGVINVRAMFGSTAVKDTKQLHLMVQVAEFKKQQMGDTDRLNGMHRSIEILAVEVPQVSIPVAPGRNLAILVEAAVRNHVLKLSGYHASAIFDKRQRKELELAN